MENILRHYAESLNGTDLEELTFPMALHAWVVLPIALPVLCVVICGLLSLIKTEQAAPVYVINLLISDLLQICAKPIAYSIKPSGVAFELFMSAYCTGLTASIYFMVCVAGERYVMITHPMWYRIHRTTKQSVLFSAFIWTVAVVTVCSVLLPSLAGIIQMDKFYIGWSLLGLLPYPFVIFFFVETWRALSKSISISPREQRRIMGMLALVLVIYTAFFLPYIVMMLLMSTCPSCLRDHSLQHLSVTTSILLSLNPLFDPMLYVFMGRRSLTTLPCCACSRPCDRQDRQRSPGDIEFSGPLQTAITAGEIHA